MASKFALSVGTIAGSLVSLALFALPAHAQATRTWVSGVGDDANPCSRTAPCKTFAGAISKTATGGEINCLDPGGFGGVTIIKAITIRCELEAGVLVSGTNAIIVNAPTNANVVLDGLDIEGLGTGLNGIQVLGGGVVQIMRCNIRHFTGNGVNVVASTVGTRVTITDSTISLNAGGVNVQGNGTPNSANINNTLIYGNSSFGLQTNLGSNAISVFRSTILGSPAAVNVLGGSTIASRGPSNVMTGTTTGLTPLNFN